MSDFARNLTLEMTLTDSPDLYVNILIGSNNELGLVDRFEVVGDPVMVGRFHEWWASAGVADLAESLARGELYYLFDSGGVVGVGGSGIVSAEEYLKRCENPGYEAMQLGVGPALAVAA